MQHDSSYNPQPGEQFWYVVCNWQDGLCDQRYGPFRTKAEAEAYMMDTTPANLLPTSFVTPNTYWGLSLGYLVRPNDTDWDVPDHFLS